jgi:predicted KAP-like P-loop ATPase
MWSDNEATNDFLNFSILASVIAETIEINGDKPLSIGVSGAWGVGKSSTLELLATRLKKMTPEPLVVRFHPWRHQSQDNVRAAFAECIARELAKCEGVKGEIKKQAHSIMKRANLMRIAGYGLGGALTLATGIPVGGFFTRGIDALAGVMDGDVNKADLDKAVDYGKNAQKTIEEWFPDGEREHSPYDNIEKICADFGKALELLDRRLVVLIDDLDRCLPATTIEALEAMRLYFFVPRTVFVIAADEEMLRLAVRKHFETAGQTLDENHLQSYYDKLIQLPFRIPSLTVPDVVIYMTLLVLEQQPSLDLVRLDAIREKLCGLLGMTWNGSRISRDTIMEIVGDESIESDFENRIAMIERLAPRLVESKRIGGNPRLIKRFMNSLAVRRSLAKFIKVPDDTGEEVLAKILLLQRCGEPALVKELELDVLRSVDGRSPVLQLLENKSPIPINEEDSKSEDEDKTENDTSKIPANVSGLWKSDFAIEWVAMAPALGRIDLRAAFHVSRGADQAFVQTVMLSRESRELVEALRKLPQTVDQLGEQIKAVTADDIPTVMNTLVEQLRTSSSDDFRHRLNCCAVFVKIHPTQVSLLVSALKSFDPNRFIAAHIVVLRDQPWAAEIEKDLKGKLDVNSPVLKAFKKGK